MTVRSFSSELSTWVPASHRFQVAVAICGASLPAMTGTSTVICEVVVPSVACTVIVPGCCGAVPGAVPVTRPPLLTLSQESPPVLV